MEIRTKTYSNIPIIAHNSEKPSIVHEERSSGKIYPSNRNFEVNIKNQKKTNIKKIYREIPIVVHDTEKPTIVIEEVNSIKTITPNQCSLTYKTLENQSKNEKIFKKGKPIIIHESEKPSIVFEEISAGKCYLNIYSSLTNYKNEKQSNKEKKNDKEENQSKIQIKSNKKGKPILIHQTEKPSIAFEETNSENYHSFIQSSITNSQNEIRLKSGKKTDQIENQSKNEKKNINKGKPIIIHESEKPSIVFEEIGAGKCFSNIQSSLSNYKSETKPNEKKNNKSVKQSKNEKNCNKKGKPILIHESEKPSVVFEEANSGKCYSNIHSSLTNYKTENKTNIEKKKDKITPSKTEKKNIKKGKPILIHESEKPSVVFEEANSGKCYSNIHSSLTNYKTENKANIEKEKDKITPSKTEKKNIKKGKPILIHESENPSIVFEEINAGKRFSNFQTSITNYKEQKKKDNKSEKKKNVKKKNIINKKYNDIPIITHESENPSIVFEEANAGNKYNKYKTSFTEYKEDNKKKKFKKKSIITVHESEKPSIVYEQINSGKLFSNIQTTKTDSKGIKKLKKVINEFKEIPIVVHNTQKPSIVFEETNTGIRLDFNHID